MNTTTLEKIDPVIKSFPGEYFKNGKLMNSKKSDKQHFQKNNCPTCIFQTECPHFILRLNDDTLECLRQLSAPYVVVKSSKSGLKALPKQPNEWRKTLHAFVKEHAQ